jgi:hypothetical protein
MTCVKSVNFSVKFNGKLLSKFRPTRGLRQGDPLSPYLVLFVAESLSSLLKEQINMGSIQELKICRRSPRISHLLFADDSLLFFKANEEQSTIINGVHRAYEASTRQLLSPTKCSLMLGQNCTDEEGQIVASILQVESTSFEEK